MDNDGKEGTDGNYRSGTGLAQRIRRFPSLRCATARKKQPAPVDGTVPKILYLEKPMQSHLKPGQKRLFIRPVESL